MNSVKINQISNTLFFMAIVAFVLLTVVLSVFNLRTHWVDNRLAQQEYGDSTLVEFSCYIDNNITKLSFNPVDEDEFIDMVAIEPTEREDATYWIFDEINTNLEYARKSKKDAIIFLRTKKGVTSIKLIKNNKYVLLNGRVSAMLDGGQYSFVSDIDRDTYKDTDWQWEKFKKEFKLTRKPTTSERQRTITDRESKDSAVWTIFLKYYN